jgi:hypothetical protein
MSEPIRTRRDPDGSVIVGRSRDPILCGKGIGDRETLSVYAGLHYHKGNHAPYFSITGAVFDAKIHRGDTITRCGCLHDEILEHFPSLAALVALHLSDINGKPMHAEANGWYDLTGAVAGNFGERYHAGNSKRHFPKAEIDPAKPWATTDYREPTEAEALAIFAEHIRAPIAEAERVRAIVRAVYNAELVRLGEGDGTYAAPPSDAPRQAAKTARKAWAEICAGYAERWAAEARAAISAHDLVIFGDGGLRDPSTWGANV